MIKKIIFFRFTIGFLAVGNDINIELEVIFHLEDHFSDKISLQCLFLVNNFIKIF